MYTEEDPPHTHNAKHSTPITEKKLIGNTHQIDALSNFNRINIYLRNIAGTNNRKLLQETQNKKLLRRILDMERNTETGQHYSTQHLYTTRPTYP